MWSLFLVLWWVILPHNTLVALRFHGQPNGEKYILLYHLTTLQSSETNGDAQMIKCLLWKEPEVAICSHRYFHVFIICMFHALQRVWCHCSSTTWHYKDFTFPWMMTDYNSSGIDRKCCYCKICKIWLPAETNMAWFSKAWPERLFPVIQQNLFLLSTVVWAQQLTNPDFNKSQRQYHCEGTSRATFSFLCYWGKPTDSTEVTGSTLSDSQSLNVHTLSSAQTPNK